MKNYSSLVDVKLLLKRILGSYWNKLVSKFCVTVYRFHARVQRSTCATYEKCNNGRVNSEIGYTTDCLYSFWNRQKAEFCVLYSFVGTIANIYLQNKNWALLTNILKVKNNTFLPDNCYTQKRIYSLNTQFKYPSNWSFLIETWIWLWPLPDILQKGLLSDGDPRMLLLQWGWGSLGFYSVSSDNFFVVTYNCLSLVLTIDFCYSQLIFFCIYLI